MFCVTLYSFSVLNFLWWPAAVIWGIVGMYRVISKGEEAYLLGKLMIYSAKHCMTPNFPFYLYLSTYRLVQFSDLIRKVSLFYDLWLMKMLTIGQSIQNKCQCLATKRCLYHALHPRLRNHQGKEGRKTIKARDQGGPDWNSTLWYGMNHKSVVAYTRLAQDQASQHSNTVERGSHEAPPLAEELLIVSFGREGQSLLFRNVIIWPYSSGWLHTHWVYEPHKLDSVSY